MLKRIYYTIWTDLIRQLQSTSASKKRWKFYSLLLMSSLMGINIIFLAAVLPNKFMAEYLDYIKLDYFKGNKLDTLLNGLIIMIPMYLINYILIFRNNKYIYIINKYTYHNGKCFFKYLLATLWIPFILLVVGMIYVRINN